MVYPFMNQLLGSKYINRKAKRALNVMIIINIEIGLHKVKQNQFKHCNYIITQFLKKMITSHVMQLIELK